MIESPLHQRGCGRVNRLLRCGDTERRAAVMFSASTRRPNVGDGSAVGAPAHRRSIEAVQSTTRGRRGRYVVSVITTPDQGQSYVVVSPAGDALYSFSDRQAAIDEAAALNGPVTPQHKQRTTALARLAAARQRD